MATTSTHPTFPSRPYNAGLPNRPGNSATATAHGAFNASTNFGGAGAQTQQHREAQRLERERQERAERERIERAGQSSLGELSEEQREEINEAVSGDMTESSNTHTYRKTDFFFQFGLFDLDKDGHIDYHELKVAMKALGFDLPKSEILSILQTHGVLASSLPSSTKSSKSQSQNFTSPSKLLLPFAAFQSLMAQRIANRDPREEILRAFDLFDESGSGAISVADLRRVARELNEPLQEEELNAMIEEFDMDGDGLISREEFVEICMG